jgi:flagellar biosynthesis protein FlhG
MTHVLPIASGKGGVGKTVIAANLGIALAIRGKTVVLVDMDLGGSNLHTCLGIRNDHPGIGNYIYHQTDDLGSLIIPTDIDRLYFIPGDVLLPGTANLPYFIKKKLLRCFQKIQADYVLLDLGAGTGFNTVDFFLSSGSGILVVTPEATSALNAYSFLKTAVYRLLIRSFPAKSEERILISEFLHQKMEGTGNDLQQLVARLKQYGNGGIKAEEVLSSFYPQIILNMGRSEEDLLLGGRLREISRKKLGIELQYIGFLPWSEEVGISLRKREPLFLLQNDNSFINALKETVQRIIIGSRPENPVLHEGDEDLKALSESSF